MTFFPFMITSVKFHHNYWLHFIFAPYELSYEFCRSVLDQKNRPRDLCFQYFEGKIQQFHFAEAIRKSLTFISASVFLLKKSFIVNKGISYEIIDGVALNVSVSL